MIKALKIFNNSGSYTAMKVPFDSSLPNTVGNQLKSYYEAGDTAQQPIYGSFMWKEELQFFFIPYTEELAHIYVGIPENQNPWDQEKEIFTNRVSWFQPWFEEDFISTVKSFNQSYHRDNPSSFTKAIGCDADNLYYMIEIPTIFNRGVLFALFQSFLVNQERKVVECHAVCNGFASFKISDGQGDFDEMIWKERGRNYYVPIREQLLDYQVVNNECNTWYRTAHNDSPYAKAKYCLYVYRDGFSRFTSFNNPLEYKEAVEEFEILYRRHVDGEPEGTKDRRSRLSPDAKQRRNVKEELPAPPEEIIYDPNEGIVQE